ncbi:replication initiation protein [Siphonobacter sp. SORGH_AS_0500]|uniref:replication initiation protein n=1 Tax=Siphonobacter sp. SORGH_AS_0500 TaxID=1864824 RepID=UPI0028608CEE|nr:replication initiation protein [Siphonobacter sp. SORGH_AS_0500]MDR6198063.1 plasmid replication initiation protein [Siphonobacter sp. SORGH_AS_0500]
MAKPSKPLFIEEVRDVVPVKKYIQIKAGKDGLIEAQSSFSINEYRVFFHLLATLHRDDDEFALQRISISDIIRENGLKDFGGQYELLREAVFNLSHRTFSRIGELDGEPYKITIPVLDKKAEPLLEENKTHILVRFHPDLKPYLLQLKSEYLSISTKYLTQLASPYSIKLYMILKHRLRQHTAYPKYPVDELRFMLSVPPDTYKRYAEFKNRILLRCMEEINRETDIQILDITELKRQRVAHTVCFALKGKPSLELSDPDELELAEPVPAPEDPLFTRLKKYLVSRSIYQGWIDKHGTEQVKTNLELGLAYLEQRNDINNPVAYLSKMVANKRPPVAGKVKEVVTPVVHKVAKPKVQDSQESARNTLRDIYANRINEVMVVTLQNPQEARLFMDFVQNLSQQERIPVHLEIAISLFNKLNLTPETLADQVKEGSGMIQGLKLHYFQQIYPEKLKQVLDIYQPLAENMGFSLV